MIIVTLSLSPHRERLLPKCWPTSSAPLIGPKNSVPAIWCVDPWRVQCSSEGTVCGSVFAVARKVEASSPMDWTSCDSPRGFQGHDTTVISPPSQLPLCKVSSLLHLPLHFASWYFPRQWSVWSSSASKTRKEYSELCEAPAWRWGEIIGWFSRGSHSYQQLRRILPHHCRHTGKSRRRSASASERNSRFFHEAHEDVYYIVPRLPKDRSLVHQHLHVVLSHSITDCL